MDNVIVDRGDGHTFQFSKADADAFIARTPGAKLVEKASSAPSEPEAPAELNLARMTKAQLEALAVERGIDLSEAKTNAERARLIEQAADVTAPDDENQGDDEDQDEE